MDKAVGEDVSACKRHQFAETTVCCQIGSKLFWVPDTDEVLDWVLTVRSKREGHEKKKKTQTGIN